jgi:hypothetical protein
LFCTIIGRYHFAKEILGQLSGNLLLACESDVKFNQVAEMNNIVVLKSAGKSPVVVWILSVSVHFFKTT